MRICVYGASSMTLDQVYLDDAFLMGKTLAERGIGMVYGAGWYGKLCTAVIYLSMFVLMLWRTAPDWFLYADAALCACLILLAFVKYAIRYGGILREARADGARKQA